MAAGRVRIGTDPPATAGDRLWRRLCVWADRARAGRIPLAGLVPCGASPLSRAACLDPGCLTARTRC
jgi:hypothetical protein